MYKQKGYKYLKCEFKRSVNNQQNYTSFTDYKGESEFDTK